MEAVEAVLRSHFLEGRSKGLLPITASPNREKRAPTTEKWALRGKIRNLLGHSVLDVVAVAALDYRIESENY